MTDDTSGPEEHSSSGEQSTGRASTVVLIVIAVLAALLVFTATLSVTEWRKANNLRQADTRRQTAATTAAQFGVALFTYDYNDLPAAKAKVLGLATPTYAKMYDTSSAAEQATIARLKARETARASGVFLTDVVRNRIAAVVVVNSSLQSTSGNRSSVTYLDVALVRQGGAWKVDAVRAVPISS